MDNGTVGDILQKQRKSLGLSTRDIADRTFINEAYIIAIENGQYSQIRDAVYVRGFIRNYAEAVGLNGNMLIQYFNEETAADDARIPVKKKESDESRKALRKSVEVVSDKKKQPDKGMSRAEKWILAVIVILRGFIRNYAEAVGLNGNMLIQYFNEETAADDARIPVKKKESDESRKALRKSVEVVSDKKKQPDKGMSRAEKWILAVIVILAVIFWIRFFYN